MRPAQRCMLHTLLAGGCLLATACVQPDGPELDEPADGQDLPILREVSATHSRITRPVRLVIRDRATLAQVPVTDVKIDFDTEMVLLAALGPTHSDELGVRIQRVWREGTKLRVLERTLHPGADREPGIDPASPWTMVVIPKCRLNVEGYRSWAPERLFGDPPGAR